LAGRLAGKKIIYTFHGAFGFRNRWTDILLRIYYLTLFNQNCQKITFASETSLSRYIDIIGCNLNNKKIELFPYGLDVKNIIPSKKKKEVRAELKLNENFVIGTAARMDHIKRIERLIEAFAMLPNEGNFKLLIMGSGDETYQKQMIRQVKNYQIENNVCFMGYRSDVLDIVNALDLFVLPSNHETFGLALLEAMSSGLPSVLMKAEWLTKEMIEDGKEGYIVNDATELAKKVIYLFNNNKTAREIGKNARMKIIENYSINKIANEYMDLYNDLI